MRVGIAGLELALLGGVLAGVPAVGASPQSSSVPQQQTLFDAEGESNIAVLETVESTTNRAPSVSGGEPSARDGEVAPREAAPGAGDGLALEDGLAPEDSLGAPELGEPDIEAVWSRHSVKPGQVSPLGELSNAFLVKTVSDAESLRLADALSAEPDVDTAVPNTFTPFERGQQDPSDDSQDCSVVYHGCMWHTADARSRCNAYTDPWPASRPIWCAR